jgi:hypothetical protein
MVDNFAEKVFLKPSEPGLSSHLTAPSLFFHALPRLGPGPHRPLGSKGNTIGITPRCNRYSNLDKLIFQRKKIIILRDFDKVIFKEVSDSQFKIVNEKFLIFFLNFWQLVNFQINIFKSQE